MTISTTTSVTGTGYKYETGTESTRVLYDVTNDHVCVNSISVMVDINLKYLGGIFNVSLTLSELGLVRRLFLIGQTQQVTT